MRSDSKSRGCSGTEFWDPPGTGRVDRAIGCRRASTYPKPTPRACWNLNGSLDVKKGIIDGTSTEKRHFHAPYLVRTFSTASDIAVRGSVNLNFTRRNRLTNQSLSPRNEIANPLQTVGLDYMPLAPSIAHTRHCSSK
jgi:hypothetical protein